MAHFKLEQDKELILDTVSELIVYQDKDLRLIWANRAAAESVGVSPEELHGRHCYEIWHKRDRPCAGCPVLKALKTGKPQKAEISSPDGREWLIRGYPVRDKNKKVIGVMEITADITERKAAEEMLRESEEFSSSLLNNSPYPIIVINPDTSVKYVNPALEKLTGFSCAEIVGRKAPYPWWTKETERKTWKELNTAMDRGAERLEELFQKKKGERFWVEITSTSVKKKGTLKYYLENWVEISERKQIEQIKSNLIRNFSHSVKTPIAMAKMACYLCEEGIKAEDAGKIKKAQRMTRDNIDKAHDDVNSILELEKKRTIELKERVSFRKIMDEIIEGTKHIVEHKNLKFQVNISENADQILANEKEIKTLLFNIIDNAVKFTDQGSIVLSARASGEMVRIRVKDTGIGIEKKDRIFDKFYKQHKTTPGVGLGLPICKEIVERYKGRIEVVSEGAEKGTVVTINLPKA